MERLHNLLGREAPLGEVCREIYAVVSGLNAPVVGAMHVTCSDESERECIDEFQRSISDPLLPSLKFGERSHFRTANLGARYEAGSLTIADDHFSVAAAQHEWKVMLVKLSSHVCVEQGADGPRFGSMRRYDTESVFCGALHAAMDGSTFASAAELRESFREGGHDRLAALLDPSRVPTAARALYAALAHAQLQARRALDEILDLETPSPTLYLVLPAVTLNRKQRDGEILCGIHRVDRRGAEAQHDYRGLGDDPAHYRLTGGASGIAVSDATLAGS